MNGYQLKLYTIFFFFVISLFINCEQKNGIVILDKNAIVLTHRTAVIGEFFFDRTDLSENINLIEYDLGYLKNLRTDSKDNLYAIDTHLNQIVSFDSTGNFRFQFIDAGQGPGEMLKPFHMQIYNDTLWVSDLNQQKICLFNTKGEFLSETRLQNGSTFSFIKANNCIMSSSKIKDKILTIQSLNSKQEKCVLSDNILKQGRDLYETRELLFGTIPKSNKIVLFQSLLGTMTIIDTSNYNAVFQFDVLSDGIKGFGKQYLDNREKTQVMSKNGPARPYNTYFSEAFINNQDLWVTLFIKEKDIRLLGIKLEYDNQLFVTPVICKNNFSYIPSIAPFNQSSSMFIFNEKYNHLEKWTTTIQQTNSYL